MFNFNAAAEKIHEAAFCSMDIMYYEVGVKVTFDPLKIKYKLSNSS